MEKYLAVNLPEPGLSPGWKQAICLNTLRERSKFTKKLPNRFLTATYSGGLACPKYVDFVECLMQANKFRISTWSMKASSKVVFVISEFWDFSTSGFKQYNLFISNVFLNFVPLFYRSVTFHQFVLIKALLEGNLEIYKRTLNCSRNT